MAMASIDLDPALVERARELTGERSNRAVIDLALRRLIASKQKHDLVEGMLAFTDLEDQLHAPVVDPSSAVGE